MGKMNLGKVRGSQIYTGTKITGNSSGIPNPTGFAADLNFNVYEGDIYINTDGMDEVNRGNIYKCITGGDADTARWIYNGNIRGPKVKVIDHLTSTSTTDAVSANQARLLNLRNETLSSEIENVKQCHEIDGSIMDGAAYPCGNIYSLLAQGVKEFFYPITHAKAVWYSREKNRTVADEIEEIKGKVGSNQFGAAEILETNKDLVMETEGLIVISGSIEGVDQGIRLDVNGIRVFYAYGYDDNAGCIRYVHSFNVYAGDVVNGNATKSIVDGDVTTPVLQFYPTGG